jgi:hypothetical protein
MSYEADRLARSREAGTYVARILRGRQAGDLPVQQANKFNERQDIAATMAEVGMDAPP